MAMTLRQIEAFRATMMAGTMVQAADFLRVSQPAVSRLISDLEREVGYPLFHRVRGRLHPTDEGNHLYADVERSFTGLNEIAHAARRIGEQQAGSLSVVSTQTVMSGRVASAIRNFTRAHPRVSLRIENRSHHQVLNWIASHQYDLGIIFEAPDHPAVVTEELSPDDCVCVLPLGHPLAAKPSLHARDLEGEVFISHPPGSYFRFRVDELFRDQGVTRNCRVDVVGAGATCSLVAAGAGVAVVEPYALWDFPVERLVVRPFRPALRVGLSLLFPVHKPVERLVRLFADAIAAELGVERATAG